MELTNKDHGQPEHLPALPPDPAQPQGLRMLVRRGVAFAAMLAVALALRSGHLTDWDSWDYAAQAIQRHCSDLCLGRWWFLAIMRAAYLVGHGVFGLDRLEGYQAMQVVGGLAMGGAVVAGMAWVYRLTQSEAAEILFAALVVTSPMLGVYGFAVMTEGLSLLTISLAFWAWERAIISPSLAGLWALGAGLAFGVAIDIREPAALLVFWPVISCLTDRPRRRWQLLALAAAGAAVTLAIGVFGAWLWYPWAPWPDPGYFRHFGQWMHEMAREQVKFPVSIPDNLEYLVQYCIASLPIAFPISILALVGAKWLSRRLLWLALGCAPFFISILHNPTLAVNPRHILPMAWALAPLAANWLDNLLVHGRPLPRRRLTATVAGVLAAGAIAFALGWSTLKERYIDYVACQEQVYRALLKLPRDAVVIPGPGTPAAYYLNRLGETEFTVIASGWAWPEEKLKTTLAAQIGSGKKVYAFLASEDWLRSARKSGEWEQLQGVIADYDRLPAPWPMLQLAPRAQSRPAREP